MIESIDHFVITVADVETTLAFMSVSSVLRA